MIPSGYNLSQHSSVARIVRGGVARARHRVCPEVSASRVGQNGNGVMTIGSLITTAHCPRCTTPIDLGAASIECSGCGSRYPRLGSIPVLVREPSAYVASCRRQLANLDQQTGQTVRVIKEQCERTDVLPITRARCRAMMDAVQSQAAEIHSILEPLLLADAADPAGELSGDDLPAPLEYIHYLYRDWGWPPAPDGENERALAAVRSVLEGQPLGRTLVLGAGGCRLAYDLQRSDPGAETVVLDIDPFLFAVAHSVIRGGRVRIREANSEIDEIGYVSKQWELTAPDGALKEDRFHFLLADGLEPPFEPGTFDTVVTPWFIDLVPGDLRDFLSTLHGLLRPGGRWLNLGPLRYTPDKPVSLRFAREEVFDLAERCGFHVAKWQTESMPYLVSKLNGRGKVEWVLAFAAGRLDEPSIKSRSGDGPPAWLIFRHLPIPTFEGQSVFWSKASLVQMVVSSIDGHRTLDDLASLVAHEPLAAGLSMTQIRGAVRRCLADVHPGCK